MKTKFYTYLLLALFASLNLLASTDTIKTGSYIINMGVVPQTIGNGLKPYGLVYELLKNHHIPVKWVINPTKSKDGIDLIHNGITYRGGAFIIDASHRTAAINAIISSWEAKGVVGNTTVSDFVVDVAKKLNYGPNWTLDKTNGHLALSYFANAGIPSSAHGDSVWKHPSELGACDDIFVLPHADPTWTDHNNLYYWNLNHKGNIWAACHAVSAIENLTSPDGSVKLNFLTTNGLVPTALHKKHSTPPFQYYHAGDFVMQFMGILDGATTNGSERSFLPLIGSDWRTTTKIGVADSVDTYIPSLSAGPAAVVAYGRAFGDENRGYVMYEAGHSLEDGGTTAEQVAAQRAFFNYSFFVAAERYADFDASISGVPLVMTAGVPVNLSLTVPEWVDLSKYTIEWSSSRGGTFAPADGKDVVYTPPITNGQTTITVSVRDACDRAVFSTEVSYIIGILSNATTLKGKYAAASKKVILEWKKEEGITEYIVERKNSNGNFVQVGRISGNSNLTTLVFEDQNPQAGTLYYRLQVGYLSGKKSYSNIIALGIADSFNEGIVSMINPATGRISFSYACDKDQVISVMLFDVNGKLISRNLKSIDAGTSVVMVEPTLKTPAGMYLLRVASNHTVDTRKIYFTP